MPESRLDRARKLLADRKVDAIVISNANSRRYLTGYTAEDHPPDESAGVAVITADRAALITSKNNVAWAQEEASDWDVIGQRYPWAIDVAELHAPFTHQQLILTEAIGLGGATKVNPSGGALAANPMFSAGLERIGFAAQHIWNGSAQRTLAHATSGPALQQNLVAVMEGRDK